jgi:hypothetical protein
MFKTIYNIIHQSLNIFFKKRKVVRTVDSCSGGAGSKSWLGHRLALTGLFMLFSRTLREIPYYKACLMLGHKDSVMYLSSLLMRHSATV